VLLGFTRKPVAGKVEATSPAQLEHVTTRSRLICTGMYERRTVVHLENQVVFVVGLCAFIFT